MDPSKVNNILEWPVPRSLKEIRGFLEIIGWYRVFIKDYSLIASPLINILNKESRSEETRLNSSHSGESRMPSSA